MLLQDVLDGIEFARGPADSEWGKLRAEMGHPEPFDLRYMAIGNEDCGKQHYEGEGSDGSLLQLFPGSRVFQCGPGKTKLERRWATSRRCLKKLDGSSTCIAARIT